jgi:hypothetical protein
VAAASYSGIDKKALYADDLPTYESGSSGEAVYDDSSVASDAVEEPIVDAPATANAMMPIASKNLRTYFSSQRRDNVIINNQSFPAYLKSV